MTGATEQLPEGWTFIVNSLTVSAGDSYATGWFVYYKMTVGGEDQSEEMLDMEYLTPFDSPTRLNIPRKLFGSENSTVDLELGPKELYAGLNTLFSLGYGSIPKHARTSRCTTSPRLAETLSVKPSAPGRRTTHGNNLRSRLRHSQERLRPH